MNFIKSFLVSNYTPKNAFYEIKIKTHTNKLSNRQQLEVQIQYARNYDVLGPVEPMQKQQNLKSPQFFYYRNIDSIGKNCLLSIVLLYRKKIVYIVYIGFVYSQCILHNFVR